MRDNELNLTNPFGFGATEQPAVASAEQEEVTTPPPAASLLFQAPEITPTPVKAKAEVVEATLDDEDEDDEAGGKRRPRKRGGRRRRKADDESENSEESAEADDNGVTSESGEEAPASKRRRQRRRDETEGEETEKKTRNSDEQITGVTGSTRLEAKRQRRREGREAGRRRAPIVSEAEFLARRESVDRVMVVRQQDEVTQIGVIEDRVLVEHYVSREAQTSLIGNVYLGRVQNVLPSMEAAFVDIGKGRNAVLYAGEVNWVGLGHPENAPRKIESVLSTGQTVLVQVSKDPVGHKGARLTSQISLPGRFLVYVPDGSASGISRKLPDTERTRLKNLLKSIVPEDAGVIVRTAAEGASEAELTRDVERLKALWADIQSKVASNNAPELLYGEPDLTLKVVRDLFTEDFTKLLVEGDAAWQLVSNYVEQVAPDLTDRIEKFEPKPGGLDVFATYRIDEQIAKGLDRKVWLPSGGSLVIDRTEAMTVVDVNTGKFTGSGGNLEETVTKNNLEAAEEIVRQLRLRDIGGIVVIDFIDMVLESNRELVLRRLIECLGRDRTRHQVAEVTSLGLVQMTRKRIGTGLLEAFSDECEHCKGRGLVLHEHPSAQKSEDRGNRRVRTRREAAPSPLQIAAMHPHEEVAEGDESAVVDPETSPAPSASDAQLDSVKPVEASLKSAASPTSDATEQPGAAAEVPTSNNAATPSADQATAVTTTEAAVVVTSTRRRSARRPAGPPQAEPTTTEPAAEQANEIGLANSATAASTTELQLDIPVPDAPESADSQAAAEQTKRRGFLWK